MRVLPLSFSIGEVYRICWPRTERDRSIERIRLHDAYEVSAVFRTGVQAR